VEHTVPGARCRALRETEAVPYRLLAHLSPLCWKHINLTGDYAWNTALAMPENPDRLRPLRDLTDAYARAARCSCFVCLRVPGGRFGPSTVAATCVSRDHVAWTQTDS